MRSRDVDTLVFVGLSGGVHALDRETGALVWSWKARGGAALGGLMSLILDGDLLVVGSNGYIWGLSAETGHQRWANGLKGKGIGLVTLASARSPVSDVAALSAAQASADSGG